ncbi:hypothetical protein ACWGI7_19910, partial [Streptomyces collinus]
GGAGAGAGGAPPPPTAPAGAGTPPGVWGFPPRGPPLRPPGRLKPEDLQSASYGAKYFGSGPDADASGGGPADWAAPLAGGAGGVLLVAAVVLWRGRRAGRADF